MNDNTFSESIDLLLANKNLILTGAPGTGKTFLARQIAEELTKGADGHIGFVQFHPSYDYTDFVEGLRPTMPDANGNIGFERMDGVFKAFCKEAIKGRGNDTSTKDNAPIEIDVLYDQLVKRIKTEPVQLRMKKGGLTNILSVNEKGNIKWGKHNSVVRKNIMDAYKEYNSTADLKDAKTNKTGLKKYAGGNISYYWAVLNYLLEEKEKQTLSSTQQQEETRFVFIIDEINRGELSKIFGELFFAIELGYRGIRGKVKTQYQNLIEKSDAFADGFYIPENVYIIGTMNDIDRSVESMDFAIRRRFAWKEIKAADTMDKMLAQLPDRIQFEAKRRMSALNEAIDNIDSLGAAYHIGAAYFLKVNTYNGDFDKLWDNHLQGLLHEYLRGMRNAEETLAKLKSAYNDAANG
jgi:5-methylcytosine-specific restriction endonuclease McrBC GTP-binding regulatory subunit McrB